MQQQPTRTSEQRRRIAGALHLAKTVRTRSVEDNHPSRGSKPPFSEADHQAADEWLPQEEDS
jgi:hypothetical protein